MQRIRRRDDCEDVATPPCRRAVVRLGERGDRAPRLQWRRDLSATTGYIRSVTRQVTREQQINRYRQMSCEERLAVALELHELACDLAREGIRRQHPGATSSVVEQRLRERLTLARDP